jgi:NAD-dependent dihydropyrimidine dehydrogenase PreA subunit
MEEIWLPRIDEQVCTGSSDCVAACPTGALGMLNNTAVLVQPDACLYCAQCEMICPVDAITLPYQIVLESRL